MPHEPVKPTWHGQPPQVARYRGWCDDVPMCRLCILEYEPGARFGNDDPADWSVDDRGEPEGGLYVMLPEGRRGPCGWCIDE